MPLTRAAWNAFLSLPALLALPVALAMLHPGAIAQTFAKTPGPEAQPPSQSGIQTTRSTDGTLTLHTSSRLVVLDVIVKDKKGHLVTDLKREDFSVTEADEPQTVLDFQRSATALAAPDARINSTAELDRVAPDAPVNIIVLDEFNTRFEDMAFARYSLKKFLEAQPAKLTTPTMLIAVDVERFAVLNDYTEDKQKILSALEHHLARNPWQLDQQSWVPARVDTAFGTLLRLARATAGHPGHKSMIWIGTGLPALNYAGLADDSVSRLDAAVQSCVNALRDARITLYSLDPAGVRTGMSVAMDSSLSDQIGGVNGVVATGLSDPFGASFEFDQLAKATGGKALRGRNDVDAEIGETVREGTGFYTLSYRPTTDSMDPRKFRKIKVSLDRPGLVVATSDGYYTEAPVSPLNPKNPSRPLLFDLVAAEQSTMVYDAVPVTVSPTANQPNSFAVNISGRALPWSAATATEPRKTQIILIASTFDRKGKELKRIANSVNIAAAANVPATGPLQGTISVPVKLEPDPNAVRARFVVRVSATGRIGTADLTLAP